MAITTTDTWYEIRDTVGMARWVKTYDTLDEAKKAIDTHNPKAQFLITKTERTLTTTDKGKFQRRELKEVAVQVYPKEIK